MTKTEELKAIIGDVPKQILNFKPIEVPKWRTRLEKCLSIVQMEITYLVCPLVIMIL